MAWPTGWQRHRPSARGSAAGPDAGVRATDVALAVSVRAVSEFTGSRRLDAFAPSAAWTVTLSVGALHRLVPGFPPMPAACRLPASSRASWLPGPSCSASRSSVALTLQGRCMVVGPVGALAAHRANAGAGFVGVARGRATGPGCAPASRPFSSQLVTTSIAQPPRGRRRRRVDRVRLAVAAFGPTSLPNASTCRSTSRTRRWSASAKIVSWPGPPVTTSFAPKPALRTSLAGALGRRASPGSRRPSACRRSRCRAGSSCPRHVRPDAEVVVARAARSLANAARDRSRR